MKELIEDILKLERVNGKDYTPIIVLIENEYLTKSKIEACKNTIKALEEISGKMSTLRDERLILTKIEEQERLIKELEK